MLAARGRFGKWDRLFAMFRRGGAEHRVVRQAALDLREWPWVSEFEIFRLREMQFLGGVER